MTTTMQSGNSQTTGLPDATLHKVHSSARKMAGDKGGPTSLGESLSAIRDRLKASDKPEPVADAADAMTAAQAQCRTWGFPWRHLREHVANISMDGKWGEKLKTLAKLRGTGFLVSLLGDRWTGKTMMACRLAQRHARIDPNFAALYVRAAEFFIAIKESYRDGGPSESVQIDRFVSPEFLVIDELNERSDTRWEDMMLTLLIDIRYADMKDTLVISNHEPAAFKESVGPSIYRRLVQTGGQIECDWPSFRDPDRRIAGGADTTKEPDDERAADG